jgi:hypothetical protein
MDNWDNHIAYVVDAWTVAEFGKHCCEVFGPGAFPKGGGRYAAYRHLLAVEPIKVALGLPRCATNAC